MKRKWISLLALIFIVGACIGGVKIYQNAATEHQYGIIPKEAKSGRLWTSSIYHFSNKRKGQTTFQTFTTIKQLKEGTVIDLLFEVTKFGNMTL